MKEIRRMGGEVPEEWRISLPHRATALYTNVSRTNCMLERG